MSGKLVRDVLDHAPEDLTSAQMLVLIALAETARDSDRIARYQTSVKDIAWRTRCSQGTVRNALSALAARALIRPLLKARIGIVQHYQIAELHEHHRPVEGHSTVTLIDKRGSLHSDTPDPKEGHSTVTLEGHSPVTLDPVENRFGRAGRVTPA